MNIRTTVEFLVYQSFCIELFDPWNGDSLIGTTVTNCINNSILYVTVCTKDSLSSKCLPIGNVTIRTAMARNSHALPSLTMSFCNKGGSTKNQYLLSGHYQLKSGKTIVLNFNPRLPFYEWHPNSSCKLFAMELPEAVTIWPGSNIWFPPRAKKHVMNGYHIKIRMSTPITDSIVPTKHIS